MDHVSAEELESIKVALYAIYSKEGSGKVSRTKRCMADYQLRLYL